MIKPIEFQTENAELLRNQIELAINSKEERIISLSAPTGAGKTLIAKLAIEPLLADATWIWLSYQPSLNKQSKDKLQKYGIPGSNLEELTADAGISNLERGTIYFFNFQKDGAGRLLSKDSDTCTSITTLLNQAKASNLPVIAIIDEAHIGSANKKQDKKARTQMHKWIESKDYPISAYIGISATLHSFEELLKNIKITKGIPIEIPYEAPKDAGLLKNELVIDYLERIIDPKDVPITVCKEGLKTYKKQVQAWNEESNQVYPLLVIQTTDKFDNENIDFINQFRQIYEEIMEEPIAFNEIRHCFSAETTWSNIEKINPEQIEGAKQVKVVLFKAALTTGWDCPRAEMLISFRPAKEKTSIIQLVGRMLRNPLGLQIENPKKDCINNAYLFLQQFDRDILNELSDEYNKQLSGGVTLTKENIELTWNPKFLEHKKDIKSKLKELFTTKRIWKGKNKCSRVKQLQHEFLKSQIQPHEEALECAELLENWISNVEKQFQNECKKELHYLHNQKTATLNISRIENGKTIQKTISIDSRDDRRRFKDLKDDTRKDENGMLESIFTQTNEILKETFPESKNHYPLLTLKDNNKLGNCLRNATKEMEAELYQILEQIRIKMLKGNPNTINISKARRELRRQCEALKDLDSLTDYGSWELMDTQHTRITKMLPVNKALHISSKSEIPSGSQPENEWIKKIESDPQILFYIRNPQGKKGLGIRYVFENKISPTYPDFIIIRGDISNKDTWKIEIVETKGGEDRKRDEFKFNGLATYARLEEMKDLDIQTNWVEHDAGSLAETNPVNITYQNRNQPNLKLS